MWYFPKSEKQRRRSDVMDAQAGLHLCCLQTYEDRFSCVEAHMRGITGNMSSSLATYCWWHSKFQIRPKGIRLFSCSTQMSLKFESNIVAPHQRTTIIWKTWLIKIHYYFSNLIRWVGSRRVGASGTTGSHETKSSVIRSFLAHPRDVIRPIGSSY